MPVLQRAGVELDATGAALLADGQQVGEDLREADPRSGGREHVVDEAAQLVAVGGRVRRVVRGTAHAIISCPVRKASSACVGRFIARDRGGTRGHAQGSGEDGT
ncbi:MAG: hypothetical protein GEV11_27380 [Streptosporangiales bacterium]|nr:hypothetical protein [Streptosporangiales bacterium]